MNLLFFQGINHFFVLKSTGRRHPEVPTLGSCKIEEKKKAFKYLTITFVLVLYRCYNNILLHFTQSKQLPLHV